MKKVIAAALLCAVSAFATWDYFPIKPAGKGELKIGVDYLTNGDGYLSLPFGARFSVIEGLEASLKSGYGISDPSGLAQPVLGLRYWMPTGLGVFVDIGLPFGEGDPALNFYPGLQYSTEFTSELSLGSEIGVFIPLEDDNKYKAGMDLKIGVELDYSLGALTPFVHAEFQIGLTKPQFDGKDNGDAAKLGIVPGVGVIYDINEMFSADAGVTFALGERYSETLTTIYADFCINF